jgi:hypothetical protein
LCLEFEFEIDISFWYEIVRQKNMVGRRGRAGSKRGLDFRVGL